MTRPAILVLTAGTSSLKFALIDADRPPGLRNPRPRRGRLMSINALPAMSVYGNLHDGRTTL